MGLQWSQNEIFHLLSKVNAWSFSDFLHESAVVKRLKIEQKPFLRFLGQMRHKMRFFKFCKKSVHGFFLNFYMKL